MQAMEAIISEVGTPKGSRIIIITGDVNGIIESHVASSLPGELITDWAMAIEKMSGIVMGNINCCVSVSLSTAEPTAANKAP